MTQHYTNIQVEIVIHPSKNSHRLDRKVETPGTRNPCRLGLYPRDTDTN